MKVKHNDCRELAELLVSKYQKEILKLSSLFKRYICFSVVTDTTQSTLSCHWQFVASTLSLVRHILANRHMNALCSHSCIRKLIYVCINCHVCSRKCIPVFLTPSSRPFHVVRGDNTQQTEVGHIYATYTSVCL